LKGVVVKSDKWGSRKLAYEIKKQKKGTYVLVDFAGQTSIVAELERMLKIDDNILKFLTVMKEDDVNLLDIEKEIQAGIPTEVKITAPEVDTPIASLETAEELPVNQETAEDAKGEKE
jgi:small subunit ribosomal protein S6